LAGAILLHHPLEKLVFIYEYTAAYFDDSLMEAVGLAMKEQPTQTADRKGHVLLTELLHGAQAALAWTRESCSCNRFGSHAPSPE